VVLFAMVQVVGTRAAAYGATPPLDRWAYLLLVAGPVALVVLDRWPLVALVGALVPTTAYFSLGYPDGPVFLAAVVALFGTIRRGYRLFTWLATGTAFAVYVALALPGVSVGRVVTVGVWTVVVLLFAEAARVRSAHFAEMGKLRAEQERSRAEEERARVEQQRRQASEERLRIARELHDVLGHHLSLINVQAGVGLHLMDEKPEQARAALTAIKHASAEALRETRSVLAALDPRDETAPRAPTPGLADLDALVAEVVAAGLPVTVRLDGDRRALPSEVDRAAYRIVQEALTNVRRHAGPDATATVVVEYGRRWLGLRVTDDGTGGASAAGTGNGIAGMRQRAVAVGGQVTAGPLPQRGFEVHASLPVPEASPPDLGAS
jgi:signal transduction histidine kinase